MSPADAILKELAGEGKVVALAFHVDYWDYRGWTDNLALPENTERQNEYRKALSLNGVYTPQVIVNGREHMNGQDETKMPPPHCRYAQYTHGADSVGFH